MTKICEICNSKFETKSATRIYCYDCSGGSTRNDNAKCIDALEFHHENPNEKEFRLGSGNTMAWKEYKAEASKCILVCSNCHKEMHSKLGYIYNENY